MRARATFMAARKLLACARLEVEPFAQSWSMETEEGGMVLVCVNAQRTKEILICLEGLKGADGETVGGAALQQLVRARQRIAQLEALLRIDGAVAQPVGEA